jgi:hypothetical protein
MGAASTTLPQNALRTLSILVWAVPLGATMPIKTERVLSQTEKV